MDSVTNLSRESKAFDSIEELQSLLHRLKVYVRDEGGFSNDKQLENTTLCKAVLIQALLQDRSHNSEGSKLSIDSSHPDWGAQNWLDGTSEDLEDALYGKSYKECKKIEERAVALLQENKPYWAWTYDHKQLYVRVVERKERERVAKQLSKLPRKVRTSLRLYKKSFKKGDKYGGRIRHSFSSRQKLRVTNETGLRKYGYVYHETKEFVFMVDGNGNEFKKKKDNVEEINPWRINYF